MGRRVRIFDTTLRDGTQCEGVAFSMEDKVRIAQRLDHLGVTYIEGGWPGSNPKDMRFFQRVQAISFKTAKLTAVSPSATESSTLAIAFEATSLLGWLERNATPAP